MDQTIKKLLDVVYAHYPRGLVFEDPAYKASAEHLRLVAARRKAGTDRAAWNGFLDRLSHQFPADGTLNDSLHLLTGRMDAAYSGKLFPASAGPDNLTIGFLVSFLVPSYLVFTSRSVPDLEAMAAPRANVRLVFEGHTCFAFPADPEAPPENAPPFEPRRQIIDFEFSTDMQPYASWIAREIEATWGYQRMPPEVGKLIVPDVATDNRGFGEATLYDCLLSDNAAILSWRNEVGSQSPSLSTS